jgi:hypothetical protein
LHIFVIFRLINFFYLVPRVPRLYFKITFIPKKIIFKLFFTKCIILSLLFQIWINEFFFVLQGFVSGFRIKFWTINLIEVGIERVKDLLVLQWEHISWLFLASTFFFLYMLRLLYYLLQFVYLVVKEVLFLYIFMGIYAGCVQVFVYFCLRHVLFIYLVTVLFALLMNFFFLLH